MMPTYFETAFYQVPFYFCEFQMILMLHHLAHSKLLGLPVIKNIIATQHSKFCYKIFFELITESFKGFLWDDFWFSGAVRKSRL